MATFLDANTGYQDWLARARSYQFGATPGWEYHRGPGGQTIGVSQGGVVQILPDETGSTEWFGRVLTAERRPGAERWTAS